MQKKIDRVREYFESGYQLTCRDALNKFHTTELRSIVSRLRKRGLDIKSLWIDETTDKEILRYKVYFLVMSYNQFVERMV